VKAANDGARLVLELLGLVAVGSWGWRTGNTLSGQLIFSVGAVLLVAAVWAVFRADEGAVVQVATGMRVVIEVALFAVATAVLFQAGATYAAIAFAAAATINEVLDHSL
jgi:hypothetical protein